MRNSLLEVWQCNSAGRYWHKKRSARRTARSEFFFGFGKMLTDDEGRYRFVTIKPGPYPWGNHQKAWRPAHIHFSLFGNVYAQRLVTQMYFSERSIVRLRSDFPKHFGPRRTSAVDRALQPGTNGR
ncbi:hypothetical protein ACFS07_16000 [Undibacterium arcticum]